MTRVERIADTNLQGQKLGKKGRITRDRIVCAARSLIEEPGDDVWSMSAVARRAELRVSSIYTYFADLTELFLTILEPVMDEAHDAYLTHLGEHWDDSELGDKSREFVQAFQAFWKRNSRLLHLRNAISDQHDPRVMRWRIDAARSVIYRLGVQMGGGPERNTGPEYDLASVLYTGLERVVTITTDEALKAQYPREVKPRFDGATVHQQARLIELAIRDERRRLAELAIN